MKILPWSPPPLHHSPPRWTPHDSLGLIPERQIEHWKNNPLPKTFGSDICTLSSMNLGQMKTKTCVSCVCIIFTSTSSSSEGLFTPSPEKILQSVSSAEWNGCWKKRALCVRKICQHATILEGQSWALDCFCHCDVFVFEINWLLSFLEMDFLGNWIHISHFWIYHL